jgi:2-keto-4-pentenoate hydratase
MNGPKKMIQEFAVARRTHGVVAHQWLDPLIDFNQAYGLQESVRIELGAKVVGWKVAAPASADVISAPLFDMGCIDSASDLADSDVLRDGLECELALLIEHSLPMGGCTRDDVMEAVGTVMPAFELLCSRLPGKFTSPRHHLVADCLGHGGVVLGAPCATWKAHDLANLRVALWNDAAPIIVERASNPFGDPLIAVALLANHLAERGQSITPGTFVLAGSHTGVYRPQPGDRLRCVFEGIGEVALNLREAAPINSKEDSDACR